MAFKPRVHEVKITADDEEQVFYIREATGREVLKSLNNTAKKSPEQNQAETFSFIVKDKEGTPLSPPEVQALMDMRFRQMLDLQKAVLKWSGLRASVDDAENDVVAKRMKEVAQRIREVAGDTDASMALAAELDKGPEKND